MEKKINRTLPLGTRSLSDKMNEIEEQKPQPAPMQEIEVLRTDTIDETAKQQAKKRYRLTEKTVGIRFDLAEDLNMELDILCIKNGINKKDFLLESVKDAIRKEKRKFEK